jgi:hypothetical protein
MVVRDERFGVVGVSTCKVWEKAEIVGGRDEIRRWMEEFWGKLRRSASEEVDVVINFGGGRLKTKVLYFKEQNIWACSIKVPSEALSTYQFHRAVPIYWQPFGVGKPSPDSVVSIAVEINIPREGKYPMLGGALIKDASERVWLAHTGRIGGGMFWKWYKGDCIEIWDGGRRYRYALIDYICSETLLKRIANFVHTVYTIKRSRVQL